MKTHCGNPINTSYSTCHMINSNSNHDENYTSYFDIFIIKALEQMRKTTTKKKQVCCVIRWAFYIFSRHTNDDIWIPVIISIFRLELLLWMLLKNWFVSIDESVEYKKFFDELDLPIIIIIIIKQAIRTYSSLLFWIQKNIFVMWYIYSYVSFK